MKIVQFYKFAHGELTTVCCWNESRQVGDTFPVKEIVTLSRYRNRYFLSDSYIEVIQSDNSTSKEYFKHSIVPLVLFNNKYLVSLFLHPPSLEIFFSRDNLIVMILAAMFFCNGITNNSHTNYAI